MIEDKVILAFKKGFRITKEGKIINPKGEIITGYENNGYIGSSFRTENSKKIKFSVHRLQAYLKFGDEMFKKGTVVRHLDGCSTNNSWNNIAIGTHSDNMMDKPKDIRDRDATNASRTMQNSIRTLEERQEIYTKLLNGVPYSEIRRQHKISKGTLSFMKNYSKEFKEFKIQKC